MTLYAPLVVTAGGVVARLPAGDQLSQVPTVVAYAPIVPLDAAVGRVFQVGLLTGDVSLVLTNLIAGCSGSVWVKQDGTGNRRVGFATPTGWVVNQDASVDLTASQSANAITRYTYAAAVVDGVNCLDIDKSTRAATLNVVRSGAFQVMSGANRVVTA